MEFIEAIAKKFCIPGNLLEAAPYGNGHINDTYLSVFNQAGTVVRYIHQRINNHVFKEPEKLMQNIDRVTGFLTEQSRGRGDKDESRKHLTLLKGADGGSFVRDRDGGYWRTYLFIEGARTVEVLDGPALAETAARCFGRFQADLAAYSGPRLFETIKDFHNTPKRYERFLDVLKKDVLGRAASVKEEIAFAESMHERCSILENLKGRGVLCEHITHNDCKLNNVMIDNETDEGLCVIDLDTVMPGIPHYDFGDMVRTFTGRMDEDEQDLSKIQVHMDIFRALGRGYLAAAGDFLSKKEVEYLSEGGEIITFTIGLRFLTDFLEGDVYFKTHKPNHNRDRCRAQFALVRSIQEHLDQMKDYLIKTAGSS